MRHPDLTSLRAFALDDGDRGSGTAGHLERCTDCRATVVSMRSIVATVREDFTQSAPPQVLDGIIARRAAGDRVILADVEEIDTRRRDMSRVTLPWAVAILLGASVVAAAMPGSPLRQWITETITQRVPDTSPTPVVPPAPAAPASPSTADTSVSGVSIFATDSVWVTVDPVLRPVRIVLRMTSQPELEVRGMDEAARATFRPRVNGIRVSGLAGGTLHIDVPMAARAFQLRVGDVVYARKAGAGGISTRARVDSTDAGLVFDVNP